MGKIGTMQDEHHCNPGWVEHKVSDEECRDFDFPSGTVGLHNESHWGDVWECNDCGEVWIAVRDDGGGLDPVSEFGTKGSGGAGSAVPAAA